MARAVTHPAGRGFVARPLDALLQAPSHMAILRVLAPRAVGMTGREIAREAGIAHKAVHDSLARLEWVGVIHRVPAGRAYLFSLNRANWLLRCAILPLLAREEEFGKRIREALAKEWEGRVISGVIFGSVARKGETPESDLDVCLVVEEKGKGGEPERGEARLSGRFSREFGLRLAPLVFTRKEFIKGYRKGSGFFRNVVREGERFAGRDLEEVIRDEKNKAHAGGEGRIRKL